MASSPSKAKKPRRKPPTSRPANTSSLAHLAAEITVSSTSKRNAPEDDEPSGPPTKRYTETASVAVRSGVEVGQDASMDALPDTQGELDVDLAELSLGQRLAATAGDAALPPIHSDEEDAEQAAHQSQEAVQPVPASSLTRTLIQALHSSDSGLLETCLAHTSPNLIQNTVRRLPPQLAVPLISACVERLARGKRAGKGKGGGAGAGHQRGLALVRWIRAVLVVHGGHLLTMPDLVARLAGLHATITARLALQDSLLSLNGRLDMVISQIEMHSSTAPAPLPLPKSAKSKGKQKRQQQTVGVSRYVEGESEDEEAEGMEVEVESGDDAESVEDVELGGSDEEEEEEAEDSEEEDEEEGEDEDEEEDDDEDFEDDDDEGGGIKINGFIDDEAEEYTDEEEEDESE